MATMSARYTVIDGEVVAQERGGVRHQLVPDRLGSTVALYDSTGAKTDTFSYWPYGESAGRTGGTFNTFGFIGALGYYGSGKLQYVRARYLDNEKSRWITKDPIGFDSGDWNVFRYSASNPVSLVDPSGLWCLIITGLNGKTVCIGNTCSGNPLCPKECGIEKEVCCTLVCRLEGSVPPECAPAIRKKTVCGSSEENACKTKNKDCQSMWEDNVGHCRKYISHVDCYKCSK